MSDEPTPLRRARDKRGLSRERVVVQLDPPMSAKTLERWEAGGRVPEWRLDQLAEIYGVRSSALLDKKAA